MPTINYLTEIHFEPGAVQRLKGVLEQLGVARPLLVTDEGLREIGMIERLGAVPAAVFSGVPTNPTEQSVLNGLQVFRQNDCDGVVAAGGGSPMDCAKCISLIATHPEPLEDYALIRGGVQRITADKPPVVAIPTTAGTGSEVGRAALITLTGGTKLGLISRYMIPDVAICDPELTTALPPQLTAATGMDAISHCVETFCSPKFNPVADAIALDGLHRAWTHLRDAVDHGQDLNLRGEMMMAALEGALAFQKGLGLIHSLSHPLGGLTHRRLHHGTLNAIFLPHVLRFNATACPEKMDRMAETLKLSGGADGLAKGFVDLIDGIGLPARLRDMEVTRDDLQSIPPAAVEDHSTPTNPRSVSAEDCQAVLDAAF